jgi:4-amino-4-deoxy-L-arabinose transferase-like glycosyltransferase
MNCAKIVRLFRSFLRSGFLPLVCIVLLGASLRLLYVRTPLLDAHRWRQVDTAAITRNLHEVRFNVFYPQVDWGGPDAYVESEFPLLPALTALLYKVFGPQEYLGRIVAIVFSIATIGAMYALARELLSHSAGLAAAFLMAVSPAAVFFGRTFMPDAPMLFFWVSGVLGFVRYFHTGSRRALWLGSAATALACLVKIPAVMMFAPIAGAAWQARRWSVLRDRAVIIALAAPLLAVTAWYWHAFTLYRETGLTFGILVHPAKTYPPIIAPGPWISTFSKWSTVELLTSSEFYLTFLARLHHFYLLPWGLAGAILGFGLWKRGSGRLIADLWLLALVAFVLVVGQGNLSHDYYQLPVVPVGALYFGAVAAPIFDHTWTTWRSVLVRATLLALVGILGFYYSGVVNTHFRPASLDIRILQAGSAAQPVVPHDALVVVADDYGVTSPLLLYYMHRKGWSFDVDNLRPEVIEGLKRKGARFFVTTVWSAIASARADAAAYLQLHPQVELRGAPGDMVVFDLTRSR